MSPIIILTILVLLYIISRQHQTNYNLQTQPAKATNNTNTTRADDTTDTETSEEERRAQFKKDFHARHLRVYGNAVSEERRQQWEDKYNQACAELHRAQRNQLAAR